MSYHPVSLTQPIGHPVWTYWGGPLPPLIQLCLETLRGLWDAHVLDRGSFNDLWMYDRDLPIDDLYVAHRADFIRAYLLRHYGGTWVDADCIALKPLKPLTEELLTYDLVVYREPAGTISNNFLMARSNSATVAQYDGAVIERLREYRPLVA